MQRVGEQLPTDALGFLAGQGRLDARVAAGAVESVEVITQAEGLSGEGPGQVRHRGSPYTILHARR